MGVRVKQGGSDRWVQNSSTAADSYVKGAENPRTPWVDATADSENNWKLGVQEASAANRFSKGVKKAGNDAWLSGVRDKGAQRFATGVALAQQRYEAGIKPYLDTIASLSLPKRGKKGDPNNIARVSAIAKALHDKKVSGKS